MQPLSSMLPMIQDFVALAPSHRGVRKDLRINGTSKIYPQELGLLEQPLDYCGDQEELFQDSSKLVLMERRLNMGLIGRLNLHPRLERAEF